MEDAWQRLQGKWTDTRWSAEEGFSKRQFIFTADRMIAFQAGASGRERYVPLKTVWTRRIDSIAVVNNEIELQLLELGGENAGGMIVWFHARTEACIDGEIYQRE